MKKVIAEVKNSKVVKDAIESRIEGFESIKRESETMVLRCKEQLTKILLGENAELIEGEMPSSVQNFIDRDFPNKVSEWKTRKTM